MTALASSIGIIGVALVLSNKVVLVILGNNCELKDLRQVNMEEGQELSNKENAKFLEISTSTGININEAFILLVKEILYKNNNNI